MGFTSSPSFGKWMALAAALLGWMFDGLEMGLFPLVANPALKDLLRTNDPEKVSQWYDLATAGFLIGAATGGVLFGWLGDRLGRVRAMMLSVMTYAVFSGLCAFASQAWQIAALRIVSALGMGGEWSLGVALVMEIWPNRSRAFLAALIGAAGNLGYLLIALLGRILGRPGSLEAVRHWLLGARLSETLVNPLVANSGWRLLMLLGAAPALLTFFIRLFVPESERWQREQGRGTTSNWASRDLWAVLAGAVGAGGILYLWMEDYSLTVRLAGSAVGLVWVTSGYIYPVLRYLQRSDAPDEDEGRAWAPTVGRMLLAACLGGIPLLATWASIQRAPTWADQQLADGDPTVKATTQMYSAFGATLGTVAGALLGNWLGRRLTYCMLCLASLASCQALFGMPQHYGGTFLLWVFVAGFFSASFYGWLPLYLPELFRTRVRATGQGFSYNFGRILAAVGVLQMGNLMKLFQGNVPKSCSVMSLIYLAGVVLIWAAPETRGRPLPE